MFTMEKFVKPWRNRTKIVSNAGTALWTPKGGCCWLSAAGQSVALTETTISVLSGPERRALQRLALHKLQALSIQCTIPSNKGEGKNFGKRLKRSLKGRKRSITENGLLFSGGKGKTAIFGTPLDVVIKNDHVSQTGVKPNPRRTRRKSEPSGISQEVKEKLSRRRRASSNTPPATATLKRQLKQNMYNSTPKKESSTTSVLRLASSSSDLNKPKRHSDGESASNIYSEQASSGWKSSRLIDALTLSSTSASASCLLKKPELPIPSPPKVPSIVLQSVDFLQTHGLHVLGIFRVPGSKKRLKQFREEFDNGFRENFSDEDNTHDVAALFKEFFRCLPEPLMTRELYSAFLSTQRFKDTKTQLEGLKYLWYLLPDSNRDTLHCLLCFLRKVASYAEDTKDENDQIIPGNKMNCRNLATLMGPNILHKVKSPHLQNFVVEDQQRAEELDEVIDVTEDLIYHHESFSTVSSEMHDQVMRFLLQTEPETVDFILRRKAKSHMGEDIENIIKGSSDIINEIDDEETNARLQHRINNTQDFNKSSSRAHSVPATARIFNSSDNVQSDERIQARCASVDAKFVKTLKPCNGSSLTEGRSLKKQRSYAMSEHAQPRMSSSTSFSYFPSSKNTRKTSNGTSSSSSLSHSPTEMTCNENTLHRERNGSSLSADDISSIAESSGELNMLCEDFDDVDMKRQWLEWEEILSGNHVNNADFLLHETFV